MSKRLVADVGGTNTRIALYDAMTGEYRAFKAFLNRDYQQFEQVIESWLAALDEAAPREGCIAVAAAPADDLVTMSNIDWTFSCSHIADRFNFENFNWINDFAAIAHALPFLGAGDSEPLFPGEDLAQGKLAALGPGTGLGGATIEWVNGKLHASACEPGHMSLSPASELELELFRVLLERYDNIYAEALVSGPGLKRLYEAVCHLRGQAPIATTPADISSSALRGDDQTCVQALHLFCGLLGSVCGDFLLANGAYKGLYLAGGIVAGMIPFLAASDFHRRLCDKGAMKNHLLSVPVSVITTEQPGLIGAAHAPLKGGASLAQNPVASVSGPAINLAP